MIKRKEFLWSSFIAAAMVLLAAPQAGAAMYPHKPIRVILATGAGGSHDMHCRAVASVIHETLGQPFLCMVRGGGGGKIGMGILKRSKPDGYTIALGSGSHFAIAPHARNMGFDPKTDFIPIFQINYAPFLLVVRKDKPWKTLADLIADARKRPGKITISSNGAWGSSHLGILQIQAAKNVKFKHVPFRGGGKAWNAMWGGHVDAGWANVTTGGTLGRIKRGELTLLATASAERMKEFPNHPTFRELGIDYVYKSWRVFLAPKGTPPDRIAILQKALHAAAKKKTLIRLIKRFGESLSPLSGPALQKAYITEIDFYGKLFKDMGFKKKKKK
jgi:tripartite-type tricarboxylate transporter receptor subunit TctC